MNPFRSTLMAFREPSPSFREAAMCTSMRYCYSLLSNQRLPPPICTMSFGYGVGDFLAVVNLAKTIKERFVNAPEQFKKISETSKTLCNVLRDIENTYQQAGLNTMQKRHLDDVYRSCYNDLNELLRRLDKYQELNIGTNSLGGAYRRFWKRLKWDQARMAEMHQRIHSDIHVFSLLSTSLTSQVAFATKELVDQINNTMEDKACHEILEWLTTVNYATQQEDFLKRRQDGTGKWLLGTDKFQQWINNENKNILCTGIPGAGKTILTAIVIENLEEKCKYDRSVGLAYIYCNFRRHNEQSVDDVLASLIKQLCQRMLSLPEDIKSLYAQHKKRQTRPKLDELFESLSVLLGHFSRIFIVVDALDEYSSRDEALRRLLLELFRLQSNSTVSIFATSRHSPAIQSAFEGCLQQEISAAAEDVRAYLEGHISQLSRVVLRNDELQKEIVNAITKTVNGMFLLAQLHLDSLEGKLSVTAIQRALKQLPSGTDAYNIAYEETMERINGKTAGEKDHIIRLVHHTAQEYFERTQTQWFPRAHYDMAKVCMAYLSYCLQSGAGLRTAGYPFARYSRHYWAHHFARALAKPGLARGLLLDKKKVVLCAQDFVTHLGIRKAFQLTVQVPELVTEAHLAAFFGSENALRELLEAGYALNSLDATNRSPLSWAAENGHEEATRFLIKQGLVIDHKDRWGLTPLALAANKGNSGVMSLLLSNGASPDLRGNAGRTPLMLGCQKGHDYVMDGDTMLRAAFDSQKKVVELLLEANCDPNLKDERGWTALHYAARNNHCEVIKLLLAKGADRLSTDNAGRTALFNAARYENGFVVDLLLKQGFDPNHMDGSGMTPLLLALEHKCYRAAMELINIGICADVRSRRRGITPLICAIQEDHHRIARSLLDCGADPNLTDKKLGRPPLVWAARRGNYSMVEALLSRGVDADSQDRNGWTALLVAIALDRKETGDEALVKQILESGGYPEAHSFHVMSPVTRPTRRGYEGIVRLLLQYKANPDAANRQGWTPLMAAAAAGRGSTRRDKYGRDAALHARRHGHDQIALLLSRQMDETNMTINEAVCTAGQPENAPLIACRATGTRESGKSPVSL
ncbi:ankyrin repeat-containing domain protein [Aspergillus welwitschiae]|uniref:Ankyrin repeat-containing domain protein n=1 Tax=Aspergillus welwitschiae TaxID=1341132 RepID=A0A3F3PXT8_9EURO|nr:ankyrin repeat-containing domain protein [Aspergillus welwitschiae]RDH31146.1 ankyrin repeat-containing domain protein [Aspergillus welwitschiae]